MRDPKHPLKPGSRHIQVVLVAALGLVISSLASMPAAAAQENFRCQATSSEPGSRTVTWSAVPGAISYQYKMSAVGVGNRYRTVSGTTVIIPVPEGTDVSISMAPRLAASSPSRVLCSDAQTPAQDSPAQPTVPIPTTPNPAAPSASGKDFSCQVKTVSSGVQVTWSRTTGASGYQYKWSVDSGPNRYVKISGSSVTSRLLPAPTGALVRVSMAPLFNDGSRISRVNCSEGTVEQPPPTTSPTDSGTTKQCVGPSDNNNFPGLRYGQFLLMNNAWNARVSNGNWSQCIELKRNAAGQVRPSWSYNWLQETAVFGPVWQVKSYPEIIYGTKSLFEASGSRAETGLPAPYGEIPQFNIDYAYTSTETRTHSKQVNGRTVYGEKNVAFETFFHTDCRIQRGVSGSNREYEIMVWVEGGPERKPDGASGLKTTTTIDGRPYQVWTKESKDPGYIAFYALDPQRSGSLDWNSFIEWARANGETYGTKPFSDSWCMGNILFGTEIWWGEGTFTVDRLDIRRS